MTNAAKKRPSAITHRNSELTGGEFLDRLTAIGWTASDFARFCGKSYTTMHACLSGKMDGRISLETERCLMLVERFPMEMLALPELQTPVRQSRTRQLANWQKLTKNARERDQMTAEGQHA